MPYTPNRRLNLNNASYKVGQNSSYHSDYLKSSETKSKMPSGYNEGEEMHHLVPAELFGAFVQNLNQRDAEIVINRANQLGIRVGNDPANFVGLNKMTEHVRNKDNPNTAHGLLDDLGLESTELSGSQRSQFRELQHKIADAPLQTRLDALPDFVSMIAEPSIEIGRSFRPMANNIEANKRLYAEEIKNEAARETAAHYKDLASEYLGVPSTTNKGLGGPELTKLIKGIKAMEDVF